VHLLAVEVLRAIDCEQVVALVELIPLQLLASLKARKVTVKDFQQRSVVMAVDDISQLSVRGNLTNGEDSAQVVALHLILKTPLKLKQGRILEIEHRVGAEVAVSQRVAHTVLSPPVIDRIDSFSQAIQQCAKTKFLRPSASAPPHDA
jgi:hypothetical protein